MTRGPDRDEETEAAVIDAANWLESVGEKPTTNKIRVVLLRDGRDMTTNAIRAYLRRAKSEGKL